jgi:hypothetical protein
VIILLVREHIGMHVGQVCMQLIAQCRRVCILDYVANMQIAEGKISLIYALPAHCCSLVLA